MTTTIAAIETSYKGCRFRSRLEARWAVFFDALDIEWQYEPQGYLLGKDRTPYLPDFWLPKMHTWVEVKGVLGRDALKTLVRAVLPDGLPRNLTGDDWTELDQALYIPRLLILGDVPEPSSEGYLHTRLDLVNGLPYRTETFFGQVGTPTGSTWVTGIAGGPGIFTEANVDQMSDDGLSSLTHGQRVWFLRPYSAVTDAYKAARSARFEHGESGAPKKRYAKPPKTAKKPATIVTPTPRLPATIDGDGWPKARPSSAGQPWATTLAAIANVESAWPTPTLRDVKAASAGKPLVAILDRNDVTTTEGKVRALIEAAPIVAANDDELARTMLTAGFGEKIGTPEAFARVIAMHRRDDGRPLSGAEAAVLDNWPGGAPEHCPC